MQQIKQLGQLHDTNYRQATTEVHLHYIQETAKGRHLMSSLHIKLSCVRMVTMTTAATKLRYRDGHGESITLIAT